MPDCIIVYCTTIWITSLCLGNSVQFQTVQNRTNVLIFILTYPLIARVTGAPQISQFPPFLPVLHCPLGLGEFQACPFPDVVFPPFPLSALSSSPFHRALQNGFGQTWWTGDMTILLQFASLYDRQVFVWSDCLLDLNTDFLVGSMVFVWDV